MLVAARLRHMAGTTWGKRCSLNMALLKDLLLEREAAEMRPHLSTACEILAAPLGIDRVPRSCQ
jgi:hypothetical protein